MMIKEGIDKYLSKNSARFFVPGHKGALSSYDVTELDGTDNLHFPSGIIADAQKFIGEAVGAKHSFMLVNGSTAGIHAAMLYSCKRGGKIIIDRGCHISVINAMIMYGITPVFVYPEIDNRFGISCGIHPRQVADVMDDNISAVLITSPTYYGVCSDIAGIAEVTHSAGVPLIVDEAHGAHFPYCDALPKSAVSAGADIVIQSVHKTLSCLTQGGLLHLCGEIVEQNEMQRCLNMVQTTSPSYLLMSSIEQAVRQMALEGKKRLTEIAAQCDELRKAVSSKYICAEKGGAFFDYDKTRLVIHTGNKAKRLHEEFNIDVELDDGANIVCIPSINNSREDFNRLYHALMSMEGEAGNATQSFPRAPLAMPPTQAYYSKKESVNPRLAVGRISAQSVYKSPPCMPVLCPGEIITQDIAELVTHDVEVV